MNVLVRGRNFEVTDKLKDYVEKRVSKLGKYLDDTAEATVILIVERGSHKIEVTVPFNGMILRGEEASGDMFTSADLTVDKLEKQIEKYKGKLFRRRGGLDQKGFVEPQLNEEEDDGPQIVKTKRFAYKPMSVDEAVMQMNLLGHSFFVFANWEDDRVNVVYKRKDGNYGLIEPEF